MSSINKIIEVVCITIEIFSREAFFSIYISAATDVNADFNSADLNKTSSRAGSLRCMSEGLSGESKHK